MNVVALTRKLVDIPSVTGEEKQVGEFLREFLSGQGWQVQTQEVAPNRFNVWATRGEAPDILLTTHVDTVPPFFPSEEDDDFVYGRGACDAKGIAAAMICAGQELARRRENDVALLFVVGEETDSAGALKACEWGLKFKYLIDGEPTDNDLVVGHKGIVHARIQCRGVTAHSAYPELGDSAIEKLLDALARLKKLTFPTHPVLGPTYLNIGLIQGGRALNVIPDEAAADILLRTVAPSRQYVDLLKGALGEQVEIRKTTEPQEMESVDGFRSKVVGYGTDIPALRPLGRPLLLGPGSIFEAHTAREKISKAELNLAVEKYIELVGRLKSRGQRS